MPSSPEEKDVYLCHTGADKDWVRQLAERLEAEQVLGRPIRVFFDEWDIDAGENILTRIEEGLSCSRFLAVVLSPALTGADWPRLEWQSQVHDDPGGRLGRIIPILRHRRDPDTGEPLSIPLPLRVLKWIDFSGDRQFEDGVAVLLRRIRGQRPARGHFADTSSVEVSDATLQAHPDPCEETLYSNLFPVTRFPRHVWSDLTTASRNAEVWAAHPGKTVPPFRIHRQRLYSFVDLESKKNLFRSFLTMVRPEREPAARLLEDPDDARLLVGLCNTALRNHCFKLMIHVAKEGTRRRFYCPVFRKTRKFRWHPEARPRSLGVLKQRPNGETFGVHQAARLAFILLGKQLFLLIEPTYVFTSDGKTPLQGKQIARYHAAWGGRERNAAVFRNVMMWARLLAKGGTDITLTLGDETLVVRGVPARADVGHGILADVVALEKLFGGEGGGEDDLEAEADFERVAVFEMAGLFDADVDVHESGDETEQIEEAEDDPS